MVSQACDLQGRAGCQPSNRAAGVSCESAALRSVRRKHQKLGSVLCISPSTRQMSLLKVPPCGSSGMRSMARCVGQMRRVWGSCCTGVSGWWGVQLEPAELWVEGGHWGMQLEGRWPVEGGWPVGVGWPVGPRGGVVQLCGSEWRTVHGERAGLSCCAEQLLTPHPAFLRFTLQSMSSPSSHTCCSSSRA